MVDQTRPIPVILDTDIGDDIDDTWALAMLLQSPELALKLVVSDTDDTRYRARIIARLLEVAGRTDVRVGVGIRQSEVPGRQQQWVSGYRLASYPGPVLEDGVQALIDTIMASPEPVTLICIGPVPNIAAALDREPRIADRARLVGMHGSLRKGYGGSAETAAEYNVRADPEACRLMFEAPWDVTITPLDTCGLVRLAGEDYAAVRDSARPLARAVMENTRIWAAAMGLPAGEIEKASSVLFDTVAVYLAFSEELLVIEKLGVCVTDNGFTLIDETARRLRCATAWRDLPAFESFVSKRILGQA
jgi:inosine-uridine nucleoside N-ribohydrolase